MVGPAVQVAAAVGSSSEKSLCPKIPFSAGDHGTPVPTMTDFWLNYFMKLLLNERRMNNVAIPVNGCLGSIRL